MIGCWHRVTPFDLDVIFIWEFLDAVAFRFIWHAQGSSRAKRNLRGPANRVSPLLFGVFFRLNLIPDYFFFRCCSPLAHDLTTFKSGFHSTLPLGLPGGGWQRNAPSHIMISWNKAEVKAVEGS